MFANKRICQLFYSQTYQVQTKLLIFDPKKGKADCKHGSDANLGASGCYDCQYELQPLQDEDLQGRLQNEQ